MMLRRLVVCSILVITPIGLGACSSDSGKTVNVTALDYSLKPDAASVAAGGVTFKVKNVGTFVHEMVVVKIASAANLPTKPDGEVDEDKIPEPEKMGEVEDIGPGTTKSLKLDLEAGKYELFCNRLDGTTSHFKEGMHVDFTVTAG